MTQHFHKLIMPVRDTTARCQDGERRVRSAQHRRAAIPHTAVMSANGIDSHTIGTAIPSGKGLPSDHVELLGVMEWNEDIFA